MFSLTITFFGVLLGLAVLLCYGKGRLEHHNMSASQKTTVLIPFKNEENRILPLLHAINRSILNINESDFQFVFVDDHSTDQTTQCILDNLNASFQIFKLKTTSGKKYAIKMGVENSKFDRILTLDADVSFNDSYLLEISKTECKSLTILPVEMDGTSVMQKLFSTEFWFLQQLTFGLAGFGKYDLCNGANLLFTKKAFNESLQIRTDSNIASGDDMFLLKAVKSLELEILAVDDMKKTVKTPAVNDFKTLFNQRLRWISKTKDVSSLIGGLIVLISNLFLLVCIIQIVGGNFTYVLPLLLKIVSELMSVNTKSKWGIVVLHQVYYPFYLVLILLKMVFKANYNWR